MEFLTVVKNATVSILEMYGVFWFLITSKLIVLMAIENFVLEASGMKFLTVVKNYVLEMLKIYFCFVKNQRFLSAFKN